MSHQSSSPVTSSSTTTKAPRIEPGSTFETLEAVLVALGVTFQQVLWSSSARFSTYGSWKAGALCSGGLYNPTCRELWGYRRRDLLEAGIGCVLAADAGIDLRGLPDQAREQAHRHLFESLELNILRPETLTLEDLEPREDDGDESDRAFWMEQVAAGRVEVVQANPIIENILDPEDRQQTSVLWDRYERVVLVVLAVDVDDEERAWLQDYGIKLDELPVKLRPADDYLQRDALRARDQLRAWRAAHVPESDTGLRVEVIQVGKGEDLPSSAYLPTDGTVVLFNHAEAAE